LVILIHIERRVTKHSLTQHSYKFSGLLVVALFINHYHMLCTFIVIYFIEFYDAYCKRMRTQSNIKDMFSLGGS